MFMITLFPTVRTPKQSELTNRRRVRKYTTEYWPVDGKGKLCDEQEPGQTSEYRET